MSELFPTFLNVVVVPDGDMWFAQSLEWDYMASGDDTLDVRRNFRRGLELTVAEHFKRFGRPHFDRTPQHEWDDLCNTPGSRRLVLSTNFLLEM